MADINPYAPPIFPDPLLQDEVPSSGPWRDGKLLVVHRLGGVLPQICLRTGQPAVVRRMEHVEWWYMTDIGRRLTTVEFGLSRSADQSNRRWCRIGCIAMIAAPAVFVTAGLLMAVGLLADRYILLLVVGSLVVLAMGGVVYSWHAPLLRFEKLRGDFIWMKGAHPDLLACLPEWPGRI